MGKNKSLENLEVRIYKDSDGKWKIEGIELPVANARLLSIGLATVIWDYKESGGDALELLRTCFRDFADAIIAYEDATKKEKGNKTALIDGVTECCGYDFGTDSDVRFCPKCGKEIVAKEGLK